MRSKVLSEKEWVTLKEASEITGRSVHAFRQLINRKRIDKIKKMQDNGPGYWVIHRDHLSEMYDEMLPSRDTSQRTISGTSQGSISDTSQMVTIPAEVYERQQKEHDNMVQGLMMYRYKFEELERQTRLLPAPLEIIPSKLTELEQKEQALRDSQEAIRNLEAELQATRSTLEGERSRSWWQRLWRK